MREIDLWFTVLAHEIEILVYIGFRVMQNYLFVVLIVYTRSFLRVFLYAITWSNVNHKHNTTAAWIGSYHWSGQLDKFRYTFIW